MSVNENIKFYRKQKKISQRELGRRIKKSGQLISLIEQGKTTPSIDTINKIALALDISADKLLLEPSSNIYISPSEKIKSSIHSAILSIMENEIDNSHLTDDEITERLLKVATELYTTEDEKESFSKITADLMHSPIKYNEQDFHAIENHVIKCLYNLAVSIGLDGFNELSRDELLNIIKSDELKQTLEYLYFDAKKKKLKKVIQKRTK
ncbi:helix-turn-helix domain-containing protein [Eubacterium multiforme]|uniref:Transcriptional regulator with XRE-family HTH domain n=1 Tax=Eubacterium multiforme TaxID=83339 RepID=A0ABT9UUQ9_9FIRM|nr:helix-turn-helix domain-containing protein [Eubacterium multiforme]MDQ0150067.1 transcriptional regulator with XRE-family HTH domain [Eubacterium multiforme]